MAVFVSGLRDDSRLKLKRANAIAPAETLLLASIVDRLSLLVWMQTKDGGKGVNRPPSILQGLYGVEPENQTQAFASGEAFEAERQRLINQAEGG